MNKDSEKKEIFYLAMMGIPPDKQGRLYHFQRKSLIENFFEHLKNTGGRI